MHYFSKKISKYPGLFADGLFDESLGPLGFNLGKKPAEVIKAREKYFRKLQIDLKNVVLQDQNHTTNIKIITKQDCGKGIFAAKTNIKNNDGMIAKESNIFLGVLSADCVPVLFYDPKKKICGAAHCGWKGILNLLVQKMIKKSVQNFGAVSKEIICYLGPSIGKCCYEVSRADDSRTEKFVKKFGKKVIKRKKVKIYPHTTTSFGVGVYLDLKVALLYQLKKCGIKKENIEVSKICTCCSKYNLPSYHRDGKLRQELLTVIGRRY